MRTSKILAVIDIGSNSIVSLIAKCYRNGVIEPINELFAITKLGKQVSQTGLLDEEAMNKTLQAAKEMKDIAEKEGAEDIIVTATHAVREAKNRSEFIVRFNKELNLFPEILSGREEAKFTYLGATSDIPNDKDALTIDIGGGSTEIAFGTKNNMLEAHSLPIGCVTICTKFKIENRLWLLNDRTSAQNYVKKQLLSITDPVNIWLKDKKPLIIASGGTVTTYAAILIEKDIYDRKQIHMRQSSKKEVAAINRKLSHMSVEERIRIPGMEKDRAEVLPGGLLILHEILSFFNLDEFFISANGLRFGIIRDYIQRRF